MQSSKMLQKVRDNSRTYEEQLRLVEQQLSAANEQELRLERDMLGNLQKLAVIQLATSTSLDSDVRRQLELRSDEEQSLRDHLQNVEAGITKNVEQLVQAKKTIRDVEAGVLDSLSKNAEYVRRSAEYGVAVQALQGISDAYAEIKAECKSKLADFDQNRLYRYLTGVGYGSVDYARTGILRTLDNWIASLCNFPTNRENEAMLLAMQKENEQVHSNRQVQVDELKSTLGQMIAGAERETGMASLVKERDELASRIKSDKKRANDMHEKLATYAEKTDERYVRAREMLTENLRSKSIDDLIAKAKATPDPDDDQLVSEVVRLKQAIEGHQSRHQNLNVEREQAYRAYTSAKDLERQLRGQRYSSDRYEYSSSLDLDSLLVGYMAGRISSDAVVRDVSNHRREVPDEPVYYPSSSGSTYGGSSWSIPSSRNSDSGSRDSGSDGGFSLSDSTGGGSFSTSDNF